ncbi:hypothetical protein J6590_009165 [Homalodisca vitripennis]|nr:hypothetical protein J6590_009165 [Homalodisca vitripennis]
MQSRIKNSRAPIYLVIEKYDTMRGAETESLRRTHTLLLAVSYRYVLQLTSLVLDPLPTHTYTHTVVVQLHNSSLNTRDLLPGDCHTHGHFERCVRPPELI